MQNAPERFVGNGRRIQPGPAQALHCRLQVVRLEADAQASGGGQLASMGVQVEREAVPGQLGPAAAAPIQPVCEAQRRVEAQHGVHVAGVQHEGRIHGWPFFPSGSASVMAWA